MENELLPCYRRSQCQSGAEGAIKGQHHAVIIAREQPLDKNDSGSDEDEAPCCVHSSPGAGGALSRPDVNILQDILVIRYGDIMSWLVIMEH